MDEESEVKKYESTVENWKEHRTGKEVEIKLAEDIATANLNEVSSRNNQNPGFTQYLNKYSPRWAKALFIIILILLLCALAAVLGLALSHI